ncbi:MAG: hypothetical protein ABI678_26790 [Kofleriaceae bacterium]
MKKPLAAAPALLLVIVALWEIAATVHAAHAVPDDPAWERATQVVRSQFRPGDLIVFAPAWADPIGRLHLGDLIPVETAARMDDAKYATIWELTIRGARAPELAGLRPDLVVDGDVEIRRFHQEPVTVISDVRDQLAELKSDGVKPTLELAEVGFAPHRCLQLEPPDHGVVTMTVPMELGSTLVGYVGLADVFKRRNIRTPGSLEIRVGAASRIVAFGVDDGWVRFELPTTPGPGEVQFLASAISRERLICFAAEARR